MLSRRKIWLLLASLVLVAAALAVATWQAPFTWRRFYVYPRTRAALDALARTRIPPATRPDGLLDLRGVIHAHSHLSHDSTGTADEIVRAAQLARLDFVVMTDHYGGLDDSAVVSEGLRGNHGGVLFFIGAEMRDGVMPLFLDRPLSHYEPHAPLQAFIDELRSQDTLVFLNHPDDPKRRWDTTGWMGMEIYNLHADARQSNLSMAYKASEQFWSMRQYPMEVLHQLFREPRGYLALWDRFTATRRVVGIAGNDAHQNNGLRLAVGKDGAIILTDTGKKEVPLLSRSGLLSRSLARLMCGPLVPGRTLWRTDADTYERIFRFVSTHVLAPGRSERDLRRSIENGHVYVAFDSLVDATGFDFSIHRPLPLASAAPDSPPNTRKAGQPGPIMGDELPFEPGLRFRVQTPVAALVRLFRNGRLIEQRDGISLSLPAPSPGVYRAEVLLRVRGGLVPWIYSNPIYVR